MYNNLFKLILSVESKFRQKEKDSHRSDSYYYVLNDTSHDITYITQATCLCFNHVDKTQPNS